VVVPEHEAAMARADAENQKLRQGGLPVSPSFFANPADGARFVRFCFCKKNETLHDAGEKLLKSLSR